MADAILTLNCGSSSIKFALFEKADRPRRIAHGQIEGLGTGAHFQAFDTTGRSCGGKLSGMSCGVSDNTVFAMVSVMYAIAYQCLWIYCKRVAINS